MSIQQPESRRLEFKDILPEDTIFKKNVPDQKFRRIKNAIVLLELFRNKKLCNVKWINRIRI